VSVAAFLDRIGAPMPWRVGPARYRGEPVHALYDRRGVKLDERIWETEDDARRMSAIGAFAPVALAYVEKAAAAGGREAQLIVDAFERAAKTPV
jgi:hypothetical protein